MCINAFFNGLSEQVKDLLTPLDLPFELDALVSLASKIDMRLQERDRIRSRSPGLQLGSYPSWGSSPRHSSAPSPTPMTNTKSDSEGPMQTGRTSKKEHLQRCNEGRCIYWRTVLYTAAVQPIRHLCWCVPPKVRTDFAGSSLMRHSSLNLSLSLPHTSILVLMLVLWTIT